MDAETLVLVEPVDVHLAQMTVRRQPRDRSVVRLQVEVGQVALRPSRPAAQRVVSESERALCSAAVSLRLS